MSPKEAAQLPANQPTELYRHFNCDGQLLYVGISLSTTMRFVGHRSSSHWSKKVTQITIERFDSRQEADQAETAAIQNEKPLHNKAKKGPQKRVYKSVKISLVKPLSLLDAFAKLGIKPRLTIP